MSRFTLARDFRNIDPKLTRVILVEAGPRILPSFRESLASRATRDLESLGVEVWTASPVTRIDAACVEVGRERIETSTALWAAGVEPSALNRTLGVPLDAQGRVLVGAVRQSATDLRRGGRPRGGPSAGRAQAHLRARLPRGDASLPRR